MILWLSKFYLHHSDNWKTFSLTQRGPQTRHRSHNRALCGLGGTQHLQAFANSGCFPHCQGLQCKFAWWQIKRQHLADITEGVSHRKSCNLSDQVGLSKDTSFQKDVEDASLACHHGTTASMARGTAQIS